MMRQSAEKIDDSWELPIFDCRLPIADGHGKELPHHFFNRQSAISNRQLKPDF